MTGIPPTTLVLQHDARHLPLADNSVDLVVTSPPYFALRSYQDGGEHYAGQIGAEPTPAEFVDSLLEVTAECMRVLKPSGSLWVNLGDKYSQRVAMRRSSHQDGLFKDRPELTKDWKASKAAGEARMPYQNVTHPDGRYVPEKSLIGIPWRYALRCIDDLGLILRAEVIWAKPNGLPESVTDRVRRSHEQWFHFTLEPRYFSAVDEIREPHVREWGGKTNGGGYYRDELEPGAKDANLPAALPNPLGKLPSSVWVVPTEPLRVPDHLGVDHFAAFPTEWPRRIIQGWSPAGVCVECGEGRRPVVTRHHERPLGGWKPDRTTEGGSNRPIGLARPSARVTVDSYTCACLEPTADTRPAVVLDPFGGTGTTAMVAKALGRHGVSVDMSADYCRIAEWRTNDEAQLERVRNMQTYGVRKPTKKQIREHEQAQAAQPEETPDLRLETESAAVSHAG